MSPMIVSMARGLGGAGGMLGRAGHMAVVVVALAGLAFVAAACTGGSAGPGVAQLGSSPDANASPHGLAAFAACMRTHGVPNFPDSGRIDVGGGIDPGSSQFRAAQEACRGLLPQGGGGVVSAKDQAAFLAFSACMRSHGVPNFPDPDFSGGGVTIDAGAGGGPDPSSPQFQAAQKACGHFLPGGGSHPQKVGPGGGAP
jgi:hypothetical protein